MQWIRTNLLLAAGGITAAVGLVLICVAALTAPPVEYGWFAYAPLANDPLVSPGLTAGEIFGLGLAGAGLIVVAGAIGYLSGRRRA